ncbi:MAG: hypothetical protein HOQ11_16635 [Gemmatimonadaceae bacterium]|nr:hypothetical protein [Gemmatimonadaceae bacterium]NUQ93324.1 hypothetical protein [Gemmatimonadaceae bacterium]NUR35955.1 hypothetical protein [Gemmatimonadaceae bacterium]NUS99030.1 hypothetical protein [Gemmatimonadaceae bacterium]
MSQISPSRDTESPRALERIRNHLGRLALGSLGALGLGAAALSLHLIPAAWRAAKGPLVVVAVASVAIEEALRVMGRARRGVRLPWLRATGALVVASFLLWRAADHLWPAAVDLADWINVYLTGALGLLGVAAGMDARRGLLRRELPGFAIGGAIAGALGVFGVAALLLAEDRLSRQVWCEGFLAAMVCLAIAAWAYVRVRRAEHRSPAA